MQGEKLSETIKADVVDTADGEALVKIKKKPGCLGQLIESINNFTVEAAKAGLFLIIGFAIGAIWAAG